MYFDPLYWLLIGAGMALSIWAQYRVKSTFGRYGRVGTSSGMTGAQVAQRILADHRISDVRIEPIAGQLTDHYDPRSKTLRLSQPVFQSSSMAGWAWPRTKWDTPSSTPPATLRWASGRHGSRWPISAVVCRCSSSWPRS